MAKFALLLPREEMVEPAGRIARELGMEVVLNRSVATEHVLEQAETCRALGADILVARGRQASLKALVDQMEQTAIDPAAQTVFISHGDCLEDAQAVAQMVKDRMGVKEVYLNHIGPVIGAHAGPGTVALFYVGTER